MEPLSEKCPGRDLNPYDLNGHRIFLPATTFAASGLISRNLESGLSLHRGFKVAFETVGAACQVSTPSRRRVRRTWLGITMPVGGEGFPEFKRFYMPDFSGCTQVV